MLVSMAWRNLARNLRRSLLTGAAVAFGLMLVIWMRGLQDGSYNQMIDQAVRTRLGHLQVMPEGYLDAPSVDQTIHDWQSLIPSLRAVEHVEGVAPRVNAEAMLSRDSELARVELLGVDREAEQRVSSVPERLLEGDSGEQWCRRELGRAVQIMGGDQQLFDRWCAAAGSSRYLPEDNDRAIVLGSGVAERLLVSVGDEVTVQAVRAGDDDESHRGSLSQRRLEVTGIVRTGNPEIDERVVYAPLATVTEMLGIEGPNELVVVLDDLNHLETAREGAVAAVGSRDLDVHTWGERNPALKNLIAVDSQSGSLMYVILVLLVALGVLNATLMSVLERVREFGVMLSLGMTSSQLFKLIMLEVALLGVAAVAVGGFFGGAFEVFGRVHGWPIEWFGGDMAGAAMSGVVYDPIYYAALTPAHAVMILGGAYLFFLLAGLFPAIKAARLEPIEAMRQQ